MAKKNDITLNLPPVDDLFSTQEERDDAKKEKVMNIPLVDISDFPDHPFHVKQDEQMQSMVDSVLQYGVLVPALVRPMPDGTYQMIAGHRRKMASMLAGLEEMPCIVRDVSDDEAIIIMVDSNLQRENILPSEKAFAYKMKLEAMNRQGQRNDLTSCPVGNKLTSASVVAKEAGDSERQIFRFVRLTELIPEILQMVDDKQVAFRPAVEISYLSHEEQTWLHEAMLDEGSTPSLSQAQRMKKMSQETGLTQEDIHAILTEEKPNQREKIVLKGDRFKKYFSRSMTEKEKEDIILKALELWYQKNRSRDRER